MINQNSTTKVLVFMRSKVDHMSGVGDISSDITIELSKNNGVFTSVVRDITEIGNGAYSVELIETDTDVVGDLTIVAKSAFADNTLVFAQVQSNMLKEIHQLYGLDASAPLVVTNSSRSAGLGIQQNIQSNDTQTIITRV